MFFLLPANTGSKIKSTKERPRRPSWSIDKPETLEFVIQFLHHLNVSPSDHPPCNLPPNLRYWNSWQECSKNHATWCIQKRAQQLLVLTRCRKKKAAKELTSLLTVSTLLGCSGIPLTAGTNAPSVRCRFIAVSAMSSSPALFAAIIATSLAKAEANL
jgi:hypothetical protein